MPVLSDLKESYRKLALDAHEIVKDETKSVADIKAALDALDPDLKKLEAQIADEEYMVDQRKRFSGVTQEPAETGPQGGAETKSGPAAQVATKSLGEMLADTPEVANVIKTVKLGAGRVSEVVEIKASLESGLTSANVINQDRQPGILPILFQRLTVADLMPSGSTNSNVVRYAKESTATNAAATVAEGALKPASALNFTIVDEPVRKIATLLKASDEIFEDLPAFASWVNGRLVLFVGIAEEGQLLSGSGTLPDLTGILNRSGLTTAQAKGADTIAVAVHKDITKIRVASFMDPTALVFHPNDWEQALFETDSNGQFFGQGPFRGPYGTANLVADTYWGLPVVSTTAMTENTILVGAFSTCAQIFRRSGITVEMTNTNNDDFEKNMITVRAEERLALAVYRPAAFSTVTGV